MHVGTTGYVCYVYGFYEENLEHVGLSFRGDVVFESKFKGSFTRTHHAVIYGSPYSSLHLSLGSWTFTRTILFEGISILVGQLTAAGLLLKH